MVAGESAGSRAAGLQPIQEYYDHTWTDYRGLWLNNDNLAIHFGYDDHTPSSHSESLKKTNQVLSDIAGISAGDRVLDAGCGVGGSAIWLAIHRRANVIGVTPVSTQVIRAREAIHRAGVNDLAAIELADYTSTPFESESFDVVWALESLCHAGSKAAFYREAWRLLRPNGRLIIAEYLRTARPLAGAEEDLLEEWLSGWAIPDIDTREEHICNAKAAGFQIIEIRDVTANMHKSLRRCYLLAMAGIYIGHLLHRLRIRNDVHHGNLIGSKLQYRALKRGLWFYGFLYATKRRTSRTESMD